MIEFPKHIDKYGNLVPIEEKDTIPFKIKRVYYKVKKYKLEIK